MTPDEPLLARGPWTVVYVHPVAHYPPLGMAWCVAAADQELGAGWRHPHIALATNPVELSEALAGPGPYLLLGTLTLWTIKDVLGWIGDAHTPECRVVVGGPSVPDPGITDAFLSDYPFVDLLVHGEGERSFIDALGWLASPSATPLQGITFRRGDTFISGPPRPRIDNLAALQVPYGTSALPGAWATQWRSFIIETNRGCPYGCTFCDWGQATQQRIHRFSMEQIMAQLDWFSAHQGAHLWITDANFGILKRDLQIAESICQHHHQTGFPNAVSVNYAKGTNPLIPEIVQQFVDAGLSSLGIISLQSLDPATLKAIDRHGISTDRLRAMGAQFIERQLPLGTQLMMGLPESTLTSSMGDLRGFFDDPIEVQMFLTIVLPGSPMANPAYQTKYGMVLDSNQMVRCTNTLSANECVLLQGCARVFHAAHRYGVLRYGFRWLQWEHGIDPLAAMLDLATDARAGRLGKNLTELCYPDDPLRDFMNSHQAWRERHRRADSWSTAMNDFTAWFEQRYDITTNDAFKALVQAQNAVMPSHSKAKQFEIALSHDVEHWYRDHRQQVGRPLAEYAPSVLHVTDPHKLCSKPCDNFARDRPRAIWELQSGLVDTRNAGWTGSVFRDSLQSLPDTLGGEEFNKRRQQDQQQRKVLVDQRQRDRNDVAQGT